MKAHMTFRRRLSRLWLLLGLQRALRLLVRAAWLFPAGFILAWALNEYTGLLPGVTSWLLAGAALAAPALLGIGLLRPRPERFAWRLDRTYGYQEQVSGGWQAVRDGSEGPVVESLFAEVGAALSQVRNRILLFGWFLLKDLLSLGIVLLALWLLFLQPPPPPPVEVEAVQVEALPPLGTDPTAAQIFPGDVPGVRTVADDEGAEGATYQTTPAMENVLAELGQALSEHAVSSDAGEAIQRGDLGEAAQALEAMADQIAGLSPQTQEALAEAFGEAASDLAASEIPAEQALAEALEEAGQALAEGDSLPARSSLDDVAAALREMDQQLQASVAALDAEPAGDEAGAPGFAGERQSSAAEDFQRLQGVGERFELQVGEEQSGMLSGGAEEAGRAFVGGAFNRILAGDDVVVDNPLLPYQYSWVWRHVVANYFTPR